MMTLQQIRDQADQAAVKAAAAHKTPYVLWNADEAYELASFPFPFLGSYIPSGWALRDKAFVDSTGLGREGEGALTIGQFRRWLSDQTIEHPGCGFAITEAGEFQVFVGVFDRV